MLMSLRTGSFLWRHPARGEADQIPCFSLTGRP